MSLRRAVFLDRDNTLIAGFETRPANTPDEMRLLPGVAAGIRNIKLLNLTTVLISNQAGIARGYMTNEVMREMNSRLNDLLITANSFPLDAFYWCPHDTDSGCNCRKPKPGMFREAAKDLGIDLATSWMIGDDDRDMQAAESAGLTRKYLLVNEHSQSKESRSASLMFPDFMSAVQAIYLLEKNA